MPTQKLTPQFIAAAIEGFEAQKTRIDLQMVELRSMLSGAAATTAAAPEAAPRKRRKFSAAVKQKMREAQQKRWVTKKAAETAELAVAEKAAPKKTAVKKKAAKKVAEPAPSLL